MALLLNIDCTTSFASVFISTDSEVIASAENHEQKEHASFLQVAIKELLSKNNIELKKIDAVSVSNGPGSYTGLRVSLASAKGICYALDKPLITINTLQLMAHAAVSRLRFSNELKKEVLFCPMIDARRMEVFTALYDRQLDIVEAPIAMIVDPSLFEDKLKTHKIIFFGSGSEKCKEVLNQTNASFVHIQATGCDLAALASKSFVNSSFADLAYSEPFYLKEFYSPNSK